MTYSSKTEMYTQAIISSKPSDQHVFKNCNKNLWPYNGISCFCLKYGAAKLSLPIHINGLNFASPYCILLMESKFSPTVHIKANARQVAVF